MEARNILVVTLLCSISVALYAQKTSSVLRDTIRPQVGKPMPDFTLNDVTNYRSKSVSLKDFRGKWLFINMWSETCYPCVVKLPKLDSLYRGHKNEANWLLIGFNKKGEGDRTPTIFEKSKARYKLEIPSAYDSLLFDAWRFNSVPTLVIVDPNGVVQYVVIGMDLTDKKMRDILLGNRVDLLESMNEWPKFDVKATNTTLPKNDIIMQSVFTKSYHDRRSGYEAIDRMVLGLNTDQTLGITYSGHGLDLLYMLAYLGEIRSQYNSTIPENKDVFWHVKPEMEDSSLFDPFINRFNYYMRMPPGERNRHNVMTSMQEDLKRAFGYQAVIEVRNVPVMELIARPGALLRLKTKGGKKIGLNANDLYGFTVTNLPAGDLLEIVTVFIQSKFLRPLKPFVDKTGLKDNFDLTLEGDLSNFDDLQNTLRKNGMELRSGTAKMRVLVVRDSK